LRITIVCGFFLPVPPVAGGAVEKMWWRLARIYARSGHQVTLISRCWEDWPAEEVRDGVRFLRLRGAAHRSTLWQNLLLDFLWGGRVLFALPEADILVTNTVALPVFVRSLRPSAGLLVVNLNRHPKGQLRWYGRAARIQAASRAIADAAVRQAPSRQTVLRIVPNSIDIARLSPSPNPRTGGAPVLIGFFGRIHPEKGLETLISAAAQLATDSTLPPWRLVLRGPTDVPRGGGGEDFLQRLRKLAPALWADDRLRLEPPLFDPEALAAAYAGLDIFCYPTEAETGEAHPVAVLEAMACGLPVVASDLPCFAGQIHAGANGLLFPVRDTSRLVTALAALIRDGAFRRRLGAAARAAVVTLDDEAVAAQHLADYQTLLDAARPH